MEIQQVVLDLVDAVIDLMEIAIVQAVQNAIASQQVVVAPLHVAEDPEGNVVVGVVGEAEVVEILYKFDRKCWSLIDNRTPEFQSSHINKILNQFNPLTDNLQQLKDQIDHYLQLIKY